MILYEDAALVVLDKPAGLSSEEGVPAALRVHWNAPDAFVGVVHRLDTGVSGLMVYARTPAAAAALSRQVTQSQDAYAVQDGRAEGKAAAPQFVKQYPGGGQLRVRRTGDGKYGSRQKGSIALQSCGLRFVHPDTGKPMAFSLPLPAAAPWKEFLE